MLDILPTHSGRSQVPHPRHLPHTDQDLAAHLAYCDQHHPDSAVLASTGEIVTCRPSLGLGRFWTYFGPGAAYGGEGGTLLNGNAPGTVNNISFIKLISSYIFRMSSKQLVTRGSVMWIQDFFCDLVYW